MNVFETIRSITNQQRLALYNKLTGKETKKFADLEKGISQTVGVAKVAGEKVVTEALRDMGLVTESTSTEGRAARAANKPTPQYARFAKKVSEESNGLLSMKPAAEDKPAPSSLSKPAIANGGLLSENQDSPPATKPTGIDKTITCTTTGETFKNAHVMWKANPTWMTSSQQDRLTKVIYDAARAGKLEEVTINGRVFHLVRPVI